MIFFKTINISLTICKKLCVLLILMILFVNTLEAQKYADKDFYLVDSLNLDLISEAEIVIMDSCLTVFHSDVYDTIRYAAISSLIDDIWSFHTIPKYVHWLYLKLDSKIKGTIKPNELYFYYNLYAISCSNEGFFKQYYGDSYSAMLFYDKALVYQRKTKNKKVLLNIYNGLGFVYERKGDIQKSLEFYLLTLDLSKELGDTSELASSLNNLGYLQNTLNNYTESLKYYSEALKLQMETGDSKEVATYLNNIGAVYGSLGESEKSFESYSEALKRYEMIQDQSGISLVLNNLGFVLMTEGENARALEYFKKSLKIRLDLKDAQGISISRNAIANVEFNLGDYESAENHAAQGYEIAKKIGSPSLILSSSKLLVKIHQRNNKPALALKMYKIKEQMKDSIASVSFKKKQLNKKAEFEFQKKHLTDSILKLKEMGVVQAQVELSRAENEKNDLLIAEQKQQQWYLFIGLGLIALFAMFMYNRFRVTNKQKYIITKQKEVADNQKMEIQKQHLLLEETHQEIKDSIVYAKRLQTAILPAFEDINEYLPDSFVFFKPKDVVSGDFYWFEHVDGVSYIAAADCTGHGVPGALVSVVCSNALNRSVKEFGIKNPAEILDKTRSLVIETFAKSGENVKDGMDIVFCAINGLKVTFSGAGNPLWIVKDVNNVPDEQIKNPKNVVIESKILIDIKGDKQPIGLYEGMLPFSQIEVKLTKGDLIFLFTDGFADQFGGEKGKKFKYRPFKKLLLHNCNLSMDEQQNELVNHFDNWKGSQEQVDDVCVIGIRL